MYLVLKKMVTFVLKAQSMAISERLQMVIKMNSMTNASFADKIGVQRSSISHVLAGRNKPSIDFIQKILVAFPKVDADWLVTGKKVGRTIAEGSTGESLSVTNEPLRGCQDQKSIPFEKPVVKDQDPEIYEGKKPDGINSQKSAGVIDAVRDRRVSKVIIFYNDGTFEEVSSID